MGKRFKMAPAHSSITDAALAILRQKLAVSEDTVQSPSAVRLPARVVLNVDNFAQRYLHPAMKQIARNRRRRERYAERRALVLAAKDMP